MFGLSLFLRSTRGTEPTPYGTAVVRFARSVLSDLGRTRDEIAAVASGAAGRVSVGAMVVVLPGLLAGAVALLKARSALTTVAIEEGDLTRLLPRLRGGELDPPTDLVESASCLVTLTFLRKRRTALAFVARTVAH